MEQSAGQIKHGRTRGLYQGRMPDPEYPADRILFDLSVKEPRGGGVNYEEDFIVSECMLSIIFIRLCDERSYYVWNS